MVAEIGGSPRRSGSSAASGISGERAGEGVDQAVTALAAQQESQVKFRPGGSWE